jgi:DNA-binding Lrp family transcriptional regulator
LTLRQCVISYAANAFIFLRVQAAKLEKVCATLRLYKDVFLIMTLFNSYDVVIGINATSPEELHRFKNKILSIDGIINDETMIRAEIKKRYYGGFLE